MNEEQEKNEQAVVHIVHPGGLVRCSRSPAIGCLSTVDGTEVLDLGWCLESPGRVWVDQSRVSIEHRRIVGMVKDGFALTPCPYCE